MSTYYLEFKLFIRSRAAWTGIIVLLLTGVLSLYFGKAFIAGQNEVIKKAATLQQQNTKVNAEHFGKDIGLFFFHNKFSMANKPGDWAAFANGQRDVNPYLISVTMLALEGQLYDNDINNPVSLMMGNMDLSFVFIFLFPLVIIAFTYNLQSELKESGLWPLLSAQCNYPPGILWRKLMVRVLVIYSVAIILLFTAVCYLQLHFNHTLFAVFGFVFLYLAFWFSLSFFIVSLGKSSSYGASVLIFCWVLGCIVLPASLNLYLTSRFPVPEALQNVINQREGYHEKWDMPKDVTMKPFFEHYPQLKKYPFPAENTFSWFWYYGMQQMGDDQALASRQAVAQKLAARQSFTQLVARFVPTIQMQLAMNELAGTDLSAHLAFQQAVRQYHEKIRLHYYPSIFQEKPLDDTNIFKTKLQVFALPDSNMSWTGMISLLAAVGLFAVLTFIRFKSGNGYQAINN